MSGRPQSCDVICKDAQGIWQNAKYIIHHQACFLLVLLGGGGRGGEGNLFRQALGARHLKCNHQEDRIPFSQSLWDGGNLGEHRWADHTGRAPSLSPQVPPQPFMSAEVSSSLSRCKA